MIDLRRYHLVLIALLVAGQFMALVHATEHPFHYQGEVCEMLSALEQHDGSIAVEVSSEHFRGCNDAFRTGYQTWSTASIVCPYPARGPPVPA